jgi:pimeloyl-ACP methyl ester carboxylesterase
MEVREHIISTSDGRKLSVLEAGRAVGVPVFALHGTPGSRLLYPAWVQDAESRGIRLISYDRPGYGGSAPQPERTVASAAQDVAAIARDLNLSRLAVWGISGGGPHALACAALLPELVAAAASLASPAPYADEQLDWMAGMGKENIAEFGAAIEGRGAIGPFVEAAAQDMSRSSPESLAQALGSLLSPVDAAAVTGDLAIYLVEGMQEGIRARRDGWMDDDLAFVKAWGFDPTQIRIPLLLVHGAQDKMVPFAHGECLAGKLPGAEARWLPEEGHLSLMVNQVAGVHEWLLSRM